MKALSEPVRLISADFQSGCADFVRKIDVDVAITEEGEATNVVYWMTLALDEDGDVLITTCPAPFREAVC